MGKRQNIDFEKFDDDYDDYDDYEDDYEKEVNIIEDKANNKNCFDSYYVKELPEGETPSL